MIRCTSPLRTDTGVARRANHSAYSTLSRRQTMYQLLHVELARSRQADLERRLNQKPQSVSGRRTEQRRTQR